MIGDDELWDKIGSSQQWGGVECQLGSHQRARCPDPMDASCSSVKQVDNLSSATFLLERQGLGSLTVLGQGAIADQM